MLWCYCLCDCFFFFFKQKTAYEMCISDWSSDVCSSYLRVIGRRCRELGVDTLLVFDVHWLVNAGYHVNCNGQFSGVYTSNELPHFIKDMQNGRASCRERVWQYV